MSRNTKQVIIIRRDLKMRRGKEGAQIAHASNFWLENKVAPLIETGIWIGKKFIKTEESMHISLAELDWLATGKTKIVCQVKSEEELITIYKAALNANIVASLIIDAGRTEFKGVATKTAVAIGPDYIELIDPITSHLELY